MPTTPTTNLLLDPLIIIPAVLAVLGVLIAVAYWQGRRWQLQTAELLRDVGQQLQQMRKMPPAIQQALAAFEPTDPPPYGELASRLHEVTTRIYGEANALHYQRNTLLRSLPEKVWRNRLAGPVIWWRIHRKAQDLHQRYLSLKEDQVEIEQLLAELENLGWGEAQTARAARAQLTAVEQTVGELAQHGVYGIALDTARDHYRDYTAELATLAPVFFTGTQQQVIDETDKSTVIAVHELLEKLVPKVNALHEQASGWKAKHADAVATITTLIEKFAAADNALHGLPTAIDAREQHSRLQNLRQIVASLNDVLRQMEVGSLDSIIDGAKRVLLAAEQVQTELTQARSDLDLVNELYPKLQNSLLYLNTQFASLETVPAYPLKWGVSADQLSTLSAEIRQIAPPGRARTPANLRTDAEQLLSLQTRQTALAEHYGAVEQQRLALVELWESDELSSVSDYLRQIEGMLPQFNTYHPNNWPKEANYKTVFDDARKLAEATQRLVPTRQSIPVTEDNLEARLVETRALVEEQRVFEERFKLLEMRLLTMQDMEKKAVARLDEALQALEDITSLGAASPLLAETTRKSMRKLREQGQKLTTIVSQRDKGKLEKKVSDIDAYASAIEHQAAEWLMGLEQGIDNEREKVATLLRRLTEVATFSETVLDDAQRLMSPDDGRRRSTPTSLKETVNELSTRSQAAAQWHDVSSMLEREVAGPVLTAYDRVLAAIDESNKAIDAAARHIPSTRRWPPTDATLENGLRSQREAETEMRAIRSQRTRAQQAAARLERLADMYASVIDQANQAGRQAQEERAAVQLLEQRLKNIKTRWEKRRREYSDKPEIVENVDALLFAVEREYQAIIQRYIDRSFNYPEVYNALQDLCDEFEAERVPVNETTSVTIDGNIVPG